MGIVNEESLGAQNIENRNGHYGDGFLHPNSGSSFMYNI